MSTPNEQKSRELPKRTLNEQRLFNAQIKSFVEQRMTDEYRQAKELVTSQANRLRFITKEAKKRNQEYFELKDGSDTVIMQYRIRSYRRADVKRLHPEMKKKITKKIEMWLLFPQILKSNGQIVEDEKDGAPMWSGNEDDAVEVDDDEELISQELFEFNVLKYVKIFVTDEYKDAKYLVSSVTSLSKLIVEEMKKRKEVQVEVKNDNATYTINCEIRRHQRADPNLLHPKIKESIMAYSPIWMSFPKIVRNGEILR